MTGNLLVLSGDCKTLYTSINRGEHFEKIPIIKSFEIKRENYLVRNLRVNNSSHQMFELNALTLSKMELNRDQAWVVWVICDSLTIYCDRSKTSSLELGTKFDVGLNFMNILNRRVNNFMIVNDMLSLFLEQSFQLSSVRDIELLINNFVKPRYMDLLIMFETDGQGGAKRKRRDEHNSKLDDFLDKMDEETEQLEYTLRGLVGTTQFKTWKEKLYKLFDRQYEKNEGRGRRKKSIELEDGNYRINEDYKSYLNLGHKVMPNFQVDKKGFGIWRNELYMKGCPMLRTVLKCIPSNKFVSIEKNMLKLFVLYFSKSGRDAVIEYVRENPEIVDFVKRRKKKIIRFIWSDSDRMYKHRFFTRFSVNDVFKTEKAEKDSKRAKKKSKKDAKFSKKKKKRKMSGKEIQNEQKEEPEPMKEKSEEDAPSGVKAEGIEKNRSSRKSMKKNKIKKKYVLVESEDKSTGNQKHLDVSQQIKSIKAETPREAPKTDTEIDTKSNPVDNKNEEIDESLTKFVKENLSLIPPDTPQPTKSTEPSELQPQDDNDPNIQLFHCYARIVKKWYSSLLLRPALSRSYSIDTISEKLIDFESSASNSTSSKKNSSISVSSLVSYVPGVGISWPPLISTPNSHSLGDRVININPDETNIVFGVLGTVIGEFKESIEVLLDEPVIGGTDLKGRVPPFRGKDFKASDLFNLSQWRQLVFENKHLAKKKQIWKGEMNVNNLIDKIKNDYSRVKRRN